ncbi:hypothetical protein ACFLRM_03690 [Acidobacteriota bacterium]
MNISPFHMLETVVTETMTVIHFAAIIMPKSTLETGKNVQNAGITLKQRCMSILVQTSIILKNWKIYLNMNQQDVLNVIVSSHLARMPIPQKEMNTSVSTVIPS